MLKTISSSDAPRLAPAIEPISPYREVFQTTDDMKSEFVKFLQTIFYQLDDKKVMEGVQKLLEDPNKTDEEIYTELLAQIGGMKKRFAPLWQLYALHVVKKGMGTQAGELMKDFQKDKFNDYMEVYNRRYLDVMRKIARLPLKGKIVDVSDSGEVTFATRLESGYFFSFPYKNHAPLNEPECQDPLTQPELTHKPIGDEVPDASVDLIACLGGLHHIPKERVESFVASMSRKLRPGAVLLLRDHDVTSKKVEAIASVVHSFVNASDGVSWAVESREVREFKSLEEWKALLERHNFTCVSPQALILKDDPTQNGMLAFVKQPQNLAELRQATSYLKNCDRGKDGTRATWIEWGNVRYSKQYADFIQNHHSYAFDYLGHLRQHWQHFATYFKECRKDGLSLKKIIFSDNFAMNIFILLAATVQCVTGYLNSLPSIVYARWKHGPLWRHVANLTDLEVFDAYVENEYSNFIDHTPFYMFDYVGKIKPMWQVVSRSREAWTTRVANYVNAGLSTLSLLGKAIVCAPIRAIYTSESNLEPDTVKVLIKDPNNELEVITKFWESEKDPVKEAKQKIEVIYSTPDGYKLVSMPRYRPFTKICSYLKETESLEVMEIGGQKEISVDLVFNLGEKPNPKKERLVYQMPWLQDHQGRHYATYQVAVSTLKKLPMERVSYIHE